MGFGGGIIGLIVLLLDIWAIVTIVQGGGSAGRKILWIILILILPAIGLIIWLIAGRK
jgi:hypothetical protein